MDEVIKGANEYLSSFTTATVENIKAMRVAYSEKYKKDATTIFVPLKKITVDGIDIIPMPIRESTVMRIEDNEQINMQVRSVPKVQAKPVLEAEGGGSQNKDSVEPSES